jgi:hypothetical protein
MSAKERTVSAEAQPLPHRDVYDRIWRSGRLLLQLHAWDAEDHPNLVNPAPRHREIWLRDPNGHVIAIASPDGETGP